MGISSNLARNRAIDSVAPLPLGFLSLEVVKVALIASLSRNLIPLARDARDASTRIAFLVVEQVEFSAWKYVAEE
jgi:hypothetical protein